ncbi:MAG: tryptophan--tRNA ligase [Actinomycetota bacterium]|nr:tryptophan--tRNA ligase [Actinomycetota bacterium]
MVRVLSGLKPTGPVTLGNYLGALRHWVEDQHQADCFFPVVDLHALTVDHDPAALRALTLEQARCLVAVGLDPDVCTLFIQSHVHEHAELCWLLECTASFGELRRMTQFKDKSQEQEFVSAGLFTYPVLMAADILVYDADRVPVGDDQRQHLELCRDIALRFNGRYGDVLVVPEATVPKVGARVKDLQEPAKKMSASSASLQGTLLLLDAPADIERKIKRAVTDTEDEVRYDRGAKPGVSNLLTILGAVTSRAPDEVASGYTRYGPLKADTAAAVIEYLRPVQERYRELADDPAGTAAVLEKGAAKAGAVAARTLARAKQAVGLLPPA